MNSAPMPFPPPQAAKSQMNQNKLPSRVVDPQVISSGHDFTPAFVDFGRQMVGGRGAPLLNLGAQGPPTRKILTSLSVHDSVHLKKSGNAWKPGMKRVSLPAEPESHITKELFKKVRSILNKVTPEKFIQLMEQVWDLTIDTEERLKGVVDLVYEKAIDEPSFSVTYGNMCSCLATLKVPTTGHPNITVNFRQLLLSRCQREFEKVKVDDVAFETKLKELDSAASTERDRLQVELKEALDVTRRRSIGNINFIGELFKLKMLNETIMHDCVAKLLQNYEEVSLECLCRLLTTIGKDLDIDEAKPRMDHYFNCMESIAKASQTPSRIRFMLLDTIDLRLQNWVPRRANQGPKTIEQIHEEAEMEEQEEQRNMTQQLFSKDTKREPDPKEQKDELAQGEETWNIYDPSKMLKFSKPQMDGNTSQVTWVKGCCGGAKAIDSVEEPEVHSVGERSSSPGLVQPEAPVERPEAQSTPPTSEPELHLPSSQCRKGRKSRKGRKRSNKAQISSPTSSLPDPFTMGNSSEELLEGPTPQSVTQDPAPEPETSRAEEPDEEPEVQPVGERSSSPGLVQPESPVERPEAQSTPPTSEVELHLPSTLSTPINLPLQESRTELETAAHEPSLMTPAALQPQASSPADIEVSSETVASDERPQVPTPPQTPDSDSRKTLESSEELLEGPTPQSVTQDPAPEPETSRAPEPDEEPEVHSVGERSSSPGLVQPEAPVERPEAQSTPPTSEPELHLPSSQCRKGRKSRKGRKRSNKAQISSPTSSLPDPFTMGNSSEELLETPTPQSVTQDPAPEPETSRAPEPDEEPEVQPVGERSSSPGLVQPEAPVERPEAQSTPPTSEAELHLPSTLSTPINLPLRESRTELETAAHEPSLMPPAALQPQASSPADIDVSSETVASDKRPQVPTPPQTPDSDSRKTLESSEELLEGPTPQSVIQDPAPEPETSRAPEPDKEPEVQSVGERSSSPGLVQPEAPVERPEAQSTPPTSEPELHLPSSQCRKGRKSRKGRKRSNKARISSPTSSLPDPFTMGNSSEELLEGPTPQSVTQDPAPEPETSRAEEPDEEPEVQPVGERSSSPGLVQPEAPVERPDAQSTPPTSEAELHLPSTLSTPINLPLRESRTELETAAHEPSLMPPAALQPQASSPADIEVSSETVASDKRPQVPTPPQTPDSDSRKTLESQYRTGRKSRKGRKRSNKPQISSPTSSLPDPFTTGNSSEELLETRTSQSVTQDPAPEPETSRAPEPDEEPEVQPVGERSSSPGLVQPESPVERPEAQSTPPTSEVELHLPSTLSTPINLPLQESRTELETAAHEPSLMPPAALQPQASSPADIEVSSETVASDERPQVPTPPQTPDSDSRKTLESSEELLEGPTPQSVTQDPAPEPETSRAPEPVEEPEVPSVGERSSSPGLVQPESPVERPEAQSTPPTSEPELHLPSSQCRKGRKSRKGRKRSNKAQISSPTSSLPDPFTMGNSSEELLEGPTPQSVTQDPAPEPETSRAPEPDEEPEVQPVGERSSSPGLVQPEAPVERPDAQSTPPTSEVELHLPSTLSTPINLPLQESRTELETAAHEPSLMTPAALQPQASSPADIEVSSETVASDERPQVPTPPQTPDSDSRKTLESQCRTGRKSRKGRKRSNKPQISSPTSSLPDPFTMENSSEELLEGPTPQSVTQDPAPEPETSRAPEPDEEPEVQPVGERSSSPGLVQPESPVERPEAQSTPPTSEVELHLPSTLSTPINLPLQESRTELETAAHEPSLMTPAALQPQASSPADIEVSSETVASDERPQVPTPPQTPDSDSRKTLESSEELLEGPTPQSVTQDPAPEPETSRAPEPVEEPEVQSVGERSSSPGLVQPEAPVERPEAQSTPPTSEPELHLPSSQCRKGRKSRKGRKRSNKAQISSPTSSLPDPFTMGNSSEELLETRTSQSVTQDPAPEPETSRAPEPGEEPEVQPVGERSSSPGLVQPEAPVERPEAQSTPPTSEVELHLPSTLSTPINLPLRESRTELETAAHEPSLMPPAALQPQASSPADIEVSYETVASDERPQVPTPPQTPDSDSRKTLESSEELLEGPTPQSVTQDPAPEPETSRAPEPVEEPEVQSVGERSSSPGLVQPEAPVERPEAQSTPPTSEPELHLPSSQCRKGRKSRKGRKRSNKAQISSPTSSLPDPFTMGNSSEELLEGPTPQSVTQDPAPEPETSRAPEPDEEPEVQPVGERSSSPGLVQPEAPVERPDAQSTPPTSEPELHLPSTLSTPINLPLQESRTELETAAHEPSLMPPAALQPQASSPADIEVSSETVASDKRPQVPTPPQTPDSDSRKTLESQCRTGRKSRKARKRSNKALISSPTSSLPDPFTMGNSSEELLETPTPQSVTQDPAPEPETSRAPEPVKPEPVVEMTEKPARSVEKIKRKSILEEFLLMNNSKSDACSSEANVSERSCSPGELTHQMERLLLEDMASGKKVFNCVKEKLVRPQLSSSPYLRDLMKAVCKAAAKENTNCRVHTALIQKTMPLYLTYRVSESERRRHALKELQALIIALDQPPNLLRIFFECLKDQDVISLDASCKRGTSEDPAGQGAGVALKTVTAFFTWLREAESEDN